MARINWQGIELEAQLIKQLPNGNYSMRSKGWGSRVEPGTVIEVKPSEIISTRVGGVDFNGPGAAAQIAGEQSGQIFTSVIPPAPMPAPANDASPIISSTTNEGAKMSDAEPQTITAAEVGALPVAILAPAALAPASASKPAVTTAPAADHFKSLVSTLRSDIQAALGKAKALKVRGPASLAAFSAAHKALSGVYDEVDAATAEINGALQGGNGAPAGTEAKN